jgi:hypothetical protein
MGSKYFDAAGSATVTKLTSPLIISDTRAWNLEEPSGSIAARSSAKRSASQLTDPVSRNRAVEHTLESARDALFGRVEGLALPCSPLHPRDQGVPHRHEGCDVQGLAVAKCLDGNLLTSAGTVSGSTDGTTGGWTTNNTGLATEVAVSMGGMVSCGLHHTLRVRDRQHPMTNFTCDPSLTSSVSGTVMLFKAGDDVDATIQYDQGCP